MKIFTFTRSILSERGEPSIKRVTLVTVLLVWIIQFFVNLFTGKAPAEYLRDQLFELILVTLGTVFGINILNGVKDIKIAQSNNNAAVGAPSPAPDTTIVTEKPTT